MPSALCCGCGGRWRVFGLETFRVPAAGSDAWAAPLARLARRAFRRVPAPGPGPWAAMAGAYRPPVVALAHARPRRAAGSPERPIREAAAGSPPYRFQPLSSSASRRTAGAAGFMILTQQSTRPERYGEPSRFDTMPSQPSAQACL
jgi:hypothetical protein